MTLESRITSSEFATVLENAAASFRTGSRDRPAADVVVQALLEAEKSAKQQRLNHPFESLLGEWQLCFATGTRKARQRAGIVLGKGFYLPKLVPAQISFWQGERENQGGIGNQIQVGLLRIKFCGVTQYLGKKNLLAFDFTELQVLAFDRVIYSGEVRAGRAKAEAFYQTSIASLPFFAFFWVTEDFIAARGRGGGLALWVKQ